MTPKAGKGLGRGLGALLGDSAVAPDRSSGKTFLPISQVEPNSSQPRRAFGDEALSELAESIRMHGIIQPLTVRPLPSGYYQIIAGERRWRAARLAGLSEVPVWITEADDKKAMELALIENLQREDLNPLEVAEGFRSLIEEYGMTQEQAAARVGRSRPALTNSLRLLLLPDDIKALVANNSLSGGHARALLPLVSEGGISQAAARVIEKGLSVRETEALVSRILKEKHSVPQSSAGKINYAAEAEQRLSGLLGRRVHIAAGRKKGKIELEFYNNDDLDNLLAALEKIQL